RLRPGSLLILPASVQCWSKAAKGARGMWMAASDSLVNGQLMPLMGAPTPEYWMSYHVPMLIDYWAGPDRAKARNRVQHELEMIRERLQDDCIAPVFAYLFVVLLAEVRRSQLPGVPVSAT